MIDKYDFKLLKDEAVSQDDFKDKTHENIANAISDMINNDLNDGITIGLEGEWGSGKSTIISIMKNKINSEKNHYFYFDAWAHEGDPLRRIFLEKLIMQTDNNGELSELKDNISKRKREIKTKTNHTVTSLGKFLSLSAFLVPFGAAILSTIDFTNITLKPTGIFEIPLIIGMITSLAPVFVILINLFINGLPTKNPKKWMFLEGESNEEIYQEVSEEEERSSIEFEYYFQKILKSILKSNKDKLVIVIDNLDRIDSDDSLKIWSTLQTFLQQKNPAEIDSEELFRKTWVIVPYDLKGLEKLWSNNNQDNNCAKSFFEKCFQMRFVVPKTVRTDWELFLKELIEQAISNWPKVDKKEIVDVLINTRKDLGDIPTPREMKTYINQVAILRQYADGSISTQSIAYYVVIKYLNSINIDNNRLREEILRKNIPNPEHQDYLNSDCAMHLSGLVFGTNPIKGQQLLLEPVISNALKSKKVEEINSLIEKFNEGFWVIFEYHIGRTHEKTVFYEYAKVLYEGIWLNYSDRTKYLLDAIKNISIMFPDDKNNDSIIYLLKIIVNDQNIAKKKWEEVVTGLQSALRDGKSNISLLVQNLSLIVDCFEESLLSRFTLNEIPLENWKKWSTESNKQNFESYKWILPKSTLLPDIAKLVQPSVVVPVDVLEMIEYCIKAELTDFNPLITSFDLHLSWNSGNYQVNNHSIELIHLLTIIALKNDSAFLLIKKIILKGEILNLISFNTTNKSIFYSIILFSIILKNEIFTIKFPVVGNSVAGITYIRDYWQTNNEANGIAVWEILKKYNRLSILWEMATDNKNILLKNIFPIAIEEKNIDFFNNNNLLNELEIVNTFLSEDEYDHVVDLFLENTSIINEIIELENIDIKKNCFEFYNLLSKKYDIELGKIIITKLKEIEKDDWYQSLLEDTYLPNLLIVIKSHNKSFSLDNNYLDGLVNYISNWFTGEIEPSEWFTGNIEELIYPFNNSFKKHFIKKATQLFWDNLENISYDSLNSTHMIIDIKNTIKANISDIQDYIEKSITPSIIYEALNVIQLLLSFDTENTFKASEDFVEVIKKPLTEAFKDADQDNIQNTLKIIAERLNVDLYISEDIEKILSDENVNE